MTETIIVPLDKTRFYSFLQEYQEWHKGNIMYLYGGCGNPCCTSKQPKAIEKQKEYIAKLDFLSGRKPSN